MNEGKQGFALLTKWVFKTNASPDSPGIVPTVDVAGGESGDEQDSCVSPSIGAIDDLHLGGLDRFRHPDGFAHEEDSFGGWIDETQEGMRFELDLFHPEAPSKERIARCYRLHRLPHLLWL
jgi:hypothetical protein